MLSRNNDAGCWTMSIAVVNAVRQEDPPGSCVALLPVPLTLTSVAELDSGYVAK